MFVAHTKQIDSKALDPGADDLPLPETDFGRS
jgi:hypothetical protein